MAEKMTANGLMIGLIPIQAKEEKAEPISAEQTKEEKSSAPVKAKSAKK